MEMLKDGDKFTTQLIGYQVAEGRKVQGGLIPEDSGFYWLFTRGEQKTELMLTPEAMFAMTQIYAKLRAKQLTAEVSWNVQENEDAIIAIAEGE
jgi:hypothetical protein